MKTMHYVALFLLGALVACNTQQSEPVDLLITNGEVYFSDKNPQTIDIAVRGDSIIAIGKKLNSKYTATKQIDANGLFVMPGFVDAHAHFYGIGNTMQNLNLLGGTTWSDLLKQVEEKAKETKDGEWILGRGWHQDKWTDQPLKTIDGYPAHDELSQISLDNPVMLSHASGHGILVNQKAMNLAGITANTVSPEGGVIVKDSHGEPIGIFQENAEQLIRQAYEKSLANQSEKEKNESWLKTIEAAQNHCLENGLTGLHDAGISLQDARQFEHLANAGILNMRIYAMLSDRELQNASQSDINYLKQINHKNFSCKAVKAYMDGALGSRGAWLIEDYTDMPGYKGENVTPLESLANTAKICADNDLQLCIHAIGDRGNREVLNIFENTLQQNLANARWRVEHAQHLHPNEIKKMGDLGVIASMQTVHCTSDAPYVPDRLGDERAEQGAYVWQSLLENNVHIANGTDAPVEKVNPFENIYAAVTRQPKSSEKAFYPNQNLSRKQAIDSYTIWNAYASFSEKKKGSIEVGKLADFTIVDRNLLTCPVEDIEGTNVAYTIVGGKVLYSKNEN